MGLKKLAAKVADYQERLKKGKARKIQPDHVKAVLERLERKQSKLKDDLKKAKTKSEKDRIESRLKIARKHRERAEWLLKKLT